MERSMMTKLEPLLVFFVLALIQGCLSIKMKGVVAPKWAEKGEMTKIKCDYDLGRDAMYSLKWFKDGEELYRYIPTNQPVQYKSFEAPGILVDEKQTKPNILVLMVTGPLGSGTYSCEVTIETPSFVTLAESANMTVMTPPIDPPQIVGVSGFYNPGDLVEINCTSLESKPAAKLHWIINGHNAQEGIFLPQKTLLNRTSGLETAISTLRFVAESHHFPQGRMKLTCVAQIEDLWEEKVTQVAYGTGDVSSPNQLLVSNSAGCHNPTQVLEAIMLILLSAFPFFAL